jgi:hypothetical protein
MAHEDRVAKCRRPSLATRTPLLAAQNAAPSIAKSEQRRDFIEKKKRACGTSRMRVHFSRLERRAANAKLQERDARSFSAFCVSPGGQRDRASSLESRAAAQVTVELVGVMTRRSNLDAEG